MIGTRRAGFIAMIGTRRAGFGHLFFLSLFALRFRANSARRFFKKTPRHTHVCEKKFCRHTQNKMSGALTLSVSPDSVATADSCRIEADFPLPNMCSICTEKFDGASTRVFDALPELCHNHRSLVWLTDCASPAKIATDLFAAYLFNPTFCAYRRVCTGCFEKSVAMNLDNRRAFVSVRGESDPDITLRIRCPVCSTNPEYAVAVEPTVWGELLTSDNEVEQDAAAAIDVNDLCKHVSPQLARDIIDAVEREYVRRHQRVLNCPVNACTHTESLDKALESDKRIKCVEHGTFCALCHELVTDGSSVAMTSNDDDGDGTVSAAGAAEATAPVRHQCSGMPKCLAEIEAIQNKSIRRCPHCFEAIERNKGCDDMFCTTCSRPFVWSDALCQQPALSERENYDDMPALEDVQVDTEPDRSMLLTPPTTLLAPTGSLQGWYMDNGASDPVVSATLNIIDAERFPTAQRDSTVENWRMFGSFFDIGWASHTRRNTHFTSLAVSSRTSWRNIHSTSPAVSSRTTRMAMATALLNNRLHEHSTRLTEQMEMQHRNRALLAQTVAPAAAPSRPPSLHEQISANVDVIMQATKADRQSAMMALLLADKDVTEAIFIAFEQRDEFSVRKDVELIVGQTNAPLDVALRVYLEKKGDIVESIMELTPIH